MTRIELTNKLNRAEIIVNKLNARLDKYLSQPNQADAKLINRICDCSYKIGIMNTYIKKLERKIYSR